MKLIDVVELKSGTPQFRLVETSDPEAPVYCFYGQQELDADLSGKKRDVNCAKKARTYDAVEVLSVGDLVFSLMSGKATLVGECHEGYLLTQNFVKLDPSPMIDAWYLVYLLNEHKGVRRQLALGQQGSFTMKYTVRQLADLLLPDLPSRTTQEVIGGLYFNINRVTALRCDVAEKEKRVVMGRIKEAH